MKISVITPFPGLYEPFFATSLVKRARDVGAIETQTYDLFSYVPPKQRIDGPTFGHSAGMVIKPEVIERAISDGESRYGAAYKIFFSPRGKKLNQKLLKSLYNHVRERAIQHIMLVPARYEGMDSRIETEYADQILSIGDFVVMGGDIPAMAFLEGFLRFVPGVVGKSESVEQDSFSGPFVDYPEYTAPIAWRGHAVPEILRSGHHKAIDDWRQEMAAQESVLHHFEWVRSYPVYTREQEQLIKKNIPPHYVVLMHSDVLVSEDKIHTKAGTTSVTSLDIHDIARSSSTYGIKNYFIVTPLSDQQTIVKTLLSFWQDGPGVSYNNYRHEALNHVIVQDSLEDVMMQIMQREGKAPVLIATGAKADDHPGLITFYEQEKVWACARPVLIVLGTGRGLTPELIKRCDYRLIPLEGFSSFNHLSVRSAAAVILDRWLGKNKKTA